MINYGFLETAIGKACLDLKWINKQTVC